MPRRAPAALVAALRRGPRRLVTLLLAGALAGALWAIAERPRYEAVATVIVVDRGEVAAEVGGGIVAGPGPASADRLVELARGERVGATAAGLLGGDLSGADLIATTSFRVSDRGATIVVRSAADIPDLAAAAANAFAAALVEEVRTIERRRLRSTAEQLEQRLGELDPLTAEAAGVREWLEAVVALEAIGDPVLVGREAELPTSARGERSLPLAAAIGGLGGAVTCLLALWFLELRRNRVRRPAEVGLALGTAPLATFRSVAEGGVTAEHPGELLLEARAREEASAVLTALGLGRGEGGPRAIAVAGASADDGARSVALTLAAALAVRELRVLLVEADLERPSLAEAIAVPPTPGLSDYLDADAPPREVMRTVAVRSRAAAGSGSAPGFLVCVPAGVGREPTGLLADVRFRTLGDRLRRAYDIVIFAAPPLLEDAGGRSVVAVTDGVLLCARLGETTAGSLLAARDLLGRADLLGTVLVA